MSAGNRRVKQTQLHGYSVQARAHICGSVKLNINKGKRYRTKLCLIGFVLNKRQCRGPCLMEAKYHHKLPRNQIVQW